VREDVRRVGSCRELGDEREREHVRKMRDGCEDAVVLRGIEDAHARTAGFPQGADGRDRVGSRVRAGRQDRRAVAEQRGERCRRAGMLGAGDRVRGHEALGALAERLRGGRDDVLLGAARVGHHGARSRVRGDRREHRRDLRDRRRDEHDVGLAKLVGPAVVERVRALHDAARARVVEVAACASDADDLADRAGGLERERAGTPDQPDADDDESFHACLAV